MSNLEIIFISMSLAMDAFAVSISNGVRLKRVKIINALKFGVFFGGFQFIMPIIGYCLANLLGEEILKFNYLISFILLSTIGLKMIMETFKKKDKDNIYYDKDILSIKNLTVLSVATSIDALAVGVSFSFINIDILKAALIGGFIAFIFSFSGVLIGKKIMGVLSKNAERIGGGVLIFMGVKILIEYFIN